jgi:hypothetical protein
MEKSQRACAYVWFQWVHCNKVFTFVAETLLEAEETQANQQFVYGVVYCAAHLSSRDWFFRIDAGRGLYRFIKRRFKCAARRRSHCHIQRGFDSASW